MAMTINVAYLYCNAKDTEPRKGYVVRDEDDEWTRDGGWFVKDGDTVNYGKTVSGAAGILSENTYVWFMHKVIPEVVKEAYERGIKDMMEIKKQEVEYYEHCLNEIKK